jgi:hypothetical protein
VAGAETATPVWDYGSYHSNGLDEWQRKCAHNAMEDVAEKFHIPGTANENMRCPDDDDNALRFHDAAAGAALLCAGACFHSQAGKYSRPFDAMERPCAQAWCDGARSVPVEFQAGKYDHRIDLETFMTCPVCRGSGVHDGHECETCKGSGKVGDPGTPENPGVLRAYTRTLPDGRSHLALIHY